jgi:CcmD family protein
MVYLAAALIILWLLVAVYVATMVARQRRLEREVGMLEEMRREKNP